MYRLNRRRNGVRDRQTTLAATLLELLREHRLSILVVILVISVAYLFEANLDLHRHVARLKDANERSYCLEATKKLQPLQDEIKDLNYKLGSCQAIEKGHKDLLEEKEKRLDEYESSLLTWKNSWTRKEEDLRRSTRRNEKLADEGALSKAWSGLFGRSSKRGYDQIGHDEEEQ